VAHVNKLPSHSPMVYGPPILWDWSNRDEVDADHHPTASYLVNAQERESEKLEQMFEWVDFLADCKTATRTVKIPPPP
jgi:hypothetical protein